MESLLSDRQDDIYAVIFYGSLILFAVVEFLLPRIKSAHGIGARWTTNIGLGVANILVTALILPIGFVALALYVESQGWGLMNLAGVPAWLAVLLGILLLDLGKYAEHVLMHKVPLLWRLHVVHHADLDVDFTTGFRHHPVEAVTGLVTVPLVILAVGTPPLAVVIFEVLAAVVAIFSHANIRYNPVVDRALRLLFMTRDAHAVHHSCHRVETDSNYGLVFLFWDRLFGTYRAAPAAGLDGMTTGVEYFREPGELMLHRVLTMPLRVPRPGLTDLPRDKRTAPPGP